MEPLFPRILSIYLRPIAFALCCLIISLKAYPQTQNNEEILRHFEKGQKLIPHIYDQDSNAWGYIFGHCRYFDYEWAEKYQIDGSGLVVGIIAHVAGNNHNPSKITHFSVYNVHEDMKPGKNSYSKTLTYDELKLDGSETKVLFDSSVYVRDSFFVAFAVADYAHDPEVLGEDTIYLLATEEGTRPEEDLKVFGRNCIRTHNVLPELAWLDAFISDEGRKSVNAYLAIFPIMDFSSSSKISNISHGGIKFFSSKYNSLEHTIKVQLHTSYTQKIKLDLLTMEGKEITSERFELFPEQKNNLQLNINSKIPPGFYLLIVSGRVTKMAQKILIY